MRTGKQIGRPITDPLVRFLPKVCMLDDGCWEWTRPVDRDGYGHFWDNVLQRMVPAHAWSYRYFIGPIPGGQHLHHTCLRTNCVNPTHVKPVTPLEHILVTAGVVSRENGLKDACDQGHPFDEKNTYWRPGGGRSCKACKRSEQRKRLGIPPDAWRVA